MSEAFWLQCVAFPIMAYKTWSKFYVVLGFSISQLSYLEKVCTVPSRCDSSSKFLPHHTVIWKWKSTPKPLVCDNPIAGDNILQNPEIFLSWRKTFLFIRQIACFGFFWLQTYIRKKSFTFVHTPNLNSFKHLLFPFNFKLLFLEFNSESRLYF